MKRILSLICLGLLAGCNVYLTPNPTPAPELNVLSATYGTDYRTQDGTSVICDNRATTLTYRFTYEGELESWASYLEGQTLGQVKGERTFTPTSRNVVAFEEQGYEVQYVMSPYFAPYENDPATPTPEAIDVVPVPQPTVIGTTKLYLTLSGVNEEARFDSQNIPVISNCP